MNMILKHTRGPLKESNSKPKTRNPSIVKWISGLFPRFILQSKISEMYSLPLVTSLPSIIRRVSVVDTVTSVAAIEPVFM